MVSREKLHSIRMSKGEGAGAYLTKITQLRGEMAAIGDTTPKEELVHIALSGFTKQWEVCMKCIVGLDYLPSWERMWDNFIQEDIREGGQHGHQKKRFEEENLSLTSKGKSKAKKGPSDESTSKGEKKKDLSKIKRFACHQPGHSASRCPNKKKGKQKKQIAASAEVDEFAARFVNELLLIACLSSSMTASVWNIDSGASCHKM